MNSEKVKEIKKALELNEYFAIEYVSKSGEPKIFTFTDLLTLINELERENAYKQEHIELWFKKNEEKKARIAELEKEKTEQLKRFAERLKEKCEWNKKQYCCSATVSVTDIDETLKELKGEV